jgi:hypothetical protein
VTPGDRQRRHVCLRLDLEDSWLHGDSLASSGSWRGGTLAAISGFGSMILGATSEEESAPYLVLGLGIQRLGIAGVVNPYGATLAGRIDAGIHFRVGERTVFADVVPTLSASDFGTTSDFSSGTVVPLVIGIRFWIGAVTNPSVVITMPFQLLARRVARVALVSFALALTSRKAIAQAAPPAPARYPLTTADGLQPHNVTVTPVVADSARRSVEGRPIDQQQLETFAVLTGSRFTDGVIELEVSGAPAPGAQSAARGFVGLAFRLQPDLATYDAFYLRPTNGRADDQVRRNHSAQYIAHPAWPWERLRRETPERYESYVDLEPGVWTRIRIEVRGTTARLFVHGQSQPTLLVNDVKSGATASGSIALWIGPGTVAHFRELRVRP